MRIELLPALNGDCILVEYLPNHFILIDGGYVDTYKHYLLPRLKEIAAQGGKLDLLVVTHIDSDHISGIVKLLEEEKLPIPIESIWYNGYRHVQSNVKVTNDTEMFVHKSICKESLKEENKPISAKQGCTLSALIMQKGLAWNMPVDGGVMKAPLSIPVGDAIIHILSPNDSNIDDLNAFWKKRLIKDGLLSKAHSNEYWDDAFEFSLSQEKQGFHFHEKKISKSYDLLKIAGEQYVPDTSATNGSSISFVLEVEGKRVLFMGDSHSETIEESLAMLYGKENKPYRFDAVKVSHHGSYNNNSPKLFSMIACDKWLISTNGDTYNHPDMPTLAYIITQDTGRSKGLYFNYRLPVCEELVKEKYHNDYQFEVIIPNGDKGLTIMV
jgi:beta-lactamase superfamily II metal-dependent hydrolase